MTPAELVNTKQEKDETLRAFMQRYNEAARRVKDANHTFVISNLPSCLKPGYFAEQLYAEPPKSMEEMQETIAKFIRIEDLRNSRRKQQQEVPTNGNKKEAKRSSNDNKGQKYLKRPYTPNSSQFEGNPHQRMSMEESGKGNKPPRRGTSRRSPEPSLRRDDQHKRRSRSRTRDPERGRSVRGRIDTISGGFVGGGASSFARKRHLRNLKTVHMVDRQPRSIPNITFTNADFHAPDLDQDDPMVITAEITRYDVSKVLVDQGSSVNILY
ncbi:uncharacterized protein LOC108327330 [Vigna angularis]|uniref:uncharacterized protein LOC108327330 n=1 Tax=Phaseolus angularis TaxID=3914 RepID=UPI000809D7A2|nr:uncharacterized protein LOC108327330 [Vigna angularis]